ncbi:MAG: hypothetical protein QM733_18295 [Ilumatobacteraceae bacterium]
MSRRIDIELTSARPDGTWTWRAAGAKEPRGILDGSLLPEGATTGAVLKADAETNLDGTTILSVASAKEKTSKGNLLEILPSERPFEGVTSQLTGRDSRERRDRRDRPPRREGSGGPGGPGRGPRGDRDRERGPRREGEGHEGGGDRGPRREHGDRDRAPRGDRPPRRTGGPRFTAPPELPQRPKAKRLKPGRTHRNAVLADLPEEQRPIAERALQGGIPAVRQAVNEQNARLKSEGKPEVPAAGLLSLAEQLLPKLRVAEWLDRADAAVRDLDELDLRDLRSVVAAAEDPMVARDESTRDIAAQLKEGLQVKQDKEMALWLEDIETAIDIGRIVRALKLSSQPPKAGSRFPADLAGKLAGASTAALSHDAFPDRWVAVLEAAAFSPIRSHVQPTDKPTQVNDELLATVKRLASLLPHVAALFEIEVDPKAQPPKPLRPTRPAGAAKKPARQIPPPPTAAPAADTTEPPADTPVEAAAEPVETSTDPAAEVAADDPVETSTDPTAAPTAATDEPVEATTEAAAESTADKPVESAAGAADEPTEAAAEVQPDTEA